MAGKSNYLQNKYIDWLFRGQAYTPPATLYIGLYTATPSDSGGGTEVTGGSYARASIASSLANWAGTQSAGSTTASSGTGTSGGTTSNNAVITFPTPSAAWGTVGWFGIFDASTSGNLLYWAPLSAAKTINSTDPAPTFQAGQLSITED